MLQLIGAQSISIRRGLLPAELVISLRNRLGIMATQTFFIELVQQQSKEKHKYCMIKTELNLPVVLLCFCKGELEVTSPKSGLELMRKGLPGISSPPYLTPTWAER